MSSRSIGLDDAVQKYLIDVSIREPDVLRRLREETATLERSAMQISPEQGQFMALLVALLDAHRIVEIGTFTGYSALCMARVLPPDGRIVACDVSDEWTRMARRYWEEAGVADRIDLRLGPATKTLGSLQEEGAVFDLAFIDADKQNYHTYDEQCLDLVRPGGLILIDNVLWSGRVADPEIQDAETIAIRELNARLRDDDRIDLSMVPIGDGLAMARRRG